MKTRVVNYVVDDNGNWYDMGDKVKLTEKTTGEIIEGTITKILENDKHTTLHIQTENGRRIVGL